MLIKPATRKVAGRSPAIGFILLFVAGLKANSCKIDLNSYLVTHPDVTFFVRASGNSMTGANIHDSDLLIVDRSLEATHDDIVIAVVHGEITVKRLHYLRGEVALLPSQCKIILQIIAPTYLVRRSQPT